MPHNYDDGKMIIFFLVFPVIFRTVPVLASFYGRGTHHSKCLWSFEVAIFWEQPKPYL